jgi:excisionase family DNA binding protein
MTRPRHTSAEPAGLLRPDGALVPDAVAGDVLHRLSASVTKEARSTGARIPAGTIAILHALNAAHERHLTPPTPTTALPSSFERTVFGGSSTVELSVADAAELLECSTRWVQRLARRGVITARRIGRTWLLDPASVEQYRRGTAA